MSRRLLFGGGVAFFVTGGSLFSAGYWAGAVRAPAVPQPPAAAPIAMTPIESIKPIEELEAPLVPAVVDPLAPEVAVVAPVTHEPLNLDIRDQAPSGAFGVQIGAFPAREEAIAFLEMNRASLIGVPIFMMATEIPSRGTWYRVRVGALESRGDAEALRKELPIALSASSMIARYP